MKIPSVTAYTREDFHNWLKKYHRKETKVAVISYRKHTGRPFAYHRELMEEAICFGWIDTTLKRIDENSYIRYFSKRNENSRWSDNTLQCAKELTKKGLMHPEGTKFYKLGLLKPTHDHEIPKNPTMPDYLKEALEKNKEAKLGFEMFPPSTKKMHYRHILRAKRPETIDKRVKELVQLSIEKYSS